MQLVDVHGLKALHIGSRTSNGRGLEPKLVYTFWAARTEQRSFSQSRIPASSNGGGVDQSVSNGFHASIRSSNRILNWFNAAFQACTRIVQRFVMLFKPRYRSLIAASSLGNKPRVFVMRRSEKFKDSTFIVYTAHLVAIG
jgi:hypothetical protein